MKITTDPSLTDSKIDKPVQMPFLKRFFDILVSSIVLIILSPLLVLIFLALKIEGLFRPESRGPFLYSEIRISQGRPFKFLKIRIFKQSVLDRTLRENGFIHTKPLERDPQNLTATGKLLKQFYLDEATQVASVFKGDMSFIGPRPWNPIDYEKEISLGIYRKKVIKAGLTGLVQITKAERQNHPGQIDGLGLDDYYIKFCRSHSPFRILLFDLWITLESLA